MNAVYKNSAMNIGAQVIIMIIMIVAMPSIVRGLGEVSFAILSLIWTVITYFTLWDLGISRSVVKFIAEKRAVGKSHDVVAIIYFSIVISFVLGSLFGVLVMAFDSPIEHLLFKVPPDYLHTVNLSLKIIAISMPILVLQGAFRGVLMGFGRFDLTNFIQIANGILQWGGSLILVLLHFGVIWVIIFVMLSRALTTIAAFVIVLRLVDMKHHGKIVDLSLFGDILKFGGWAMTSQVVSPLLQYTERFILSGAIATSVVTFYVVPYEATSKMLVLSVGMVSALFPAMSGIHGAGGLSHEFKRLYGQAERIMVFAFLPICAVLVSFAPEILKVWMGSSFAQNAELVFEILSIAFLINSVAQLPFTAIQAAGRSDLTGKTHLVELPIYILLALFLIKNFGLVGAAVATLSRIILDASLLYSVAWKKLGIEIELFKEFRKKFLLPTLVISAMLLSGFLVQHNLFAKGVLSVVLLLLYVGSVSKFSLEESEKRFLKSLLLRKSSL